MLFDSVEFLLFIVIFFATYWAMKDRLAYQNMLILVGSYIFYGFWSYKFLSLIIISSTVDYLVGLKIYNTSNEKSRKLLLSISLIVNLGLLFVFKYYNFFIEGFADLVSAFGFRSNMSTLNVILPVGISFYTFQTLSYTIDIYKSKLKPTKSVLDFFSYVAFFPQLVAGPIERAINLLPQFSIKRQFSLAQGKDGLRQIAWGLFKKAVIADNCAHYVEIIFSDHATMYGPILILGGLLFVIQVYCDFSGYSDVAIGTARLLGFNLMQNFNNPYLSLNSTEFWRRWHISMSSWFRDYVFNPLVIKFRSHAKLGLIISTIITFTIIGLWHGPNWTYIFFGLLQGLVLVVEIFTAKRRKKIRKKLKKNTILSRLYKLSSWFLTMAFWTYLCIIFRSADMRQAFVYMKNTLVKSNLSFITELKYLEFLNFGFLTLLIGSILVFIIEYLNREYEHGLVKLNVVKPLRYLFYFVLTGSIFHNLALEEPFIYFQF